MVKSKRAIELVVNLINIAGEVTGSVIQHCPIFKAFYDKKFDESTTHQHK